MFINISCIIWRRHHLQGNSLNLDCDVYSTLCHSRELEYSTITVKYWNIAYVVKKSNRAFNVSSHKSSSSWHHTCKLSTQIYRLLLCLLCFHYIRKISRLSEYVVDLCWPVCHFVNFVPIIIDKKIIQLINTISSCSTFYS